MTMTRQLYSISALATELGRDRRTIASALRAVPAEGTIRGGHKGWYLITALDALGDGRKQRGDDYTGALEIYLDRLEDWREIYGRDEISWPIDKLAAALEKPVSTLLTWLRAGCPYVVAGDYETGDGFVLRPAWVFDWTMAANALSRYSDDKAGAAELDLI